MRCFCAFRFTLDGSIVECVAIKSTPVNVKYCRLFHHIEGSSFCYKKYSYPSVRVDSIGMNSKKGFFSMNSRNMKVVNVVNR